MEQDEIVQTIAEQANDLCQIQDHVTRVVANLDVDPAWFSGYDEPGRAKFDRDVVGEREDSKLYERLKGQA